MKLFLGLIGSMIGAFAFGIIWSNYIHKTNTPIAPIVAKAEPIIYKRPFAKVYFLFVQDSKDAVTRFGISLDEGDRLKKQSIVRGSTSSDLAFHTLNGTYFVLREMGKYWIEVGRIDQESRIVPINETDTEFIGKMPAEKP